MLRIIQKFFVVLSKIKLLEIKICFFSYFALTLKFTTLITYGSIKKSNFYLYKRAYLYEYYFFLRGSYQFKC